MIKIERVISVFKAAEYHRGSGWLRRSIRRLPEVRPAP
jgi:hypothetical protein